MVTIELREGWMSFRFHGVESSRMAELLVERRTRLPEARWLPSEKRWVLPRSDDLLNRLLGWVYEKFGETGVQVRTAPSRHSGWALV